MNASPLLGWPGAVPAEGIDVGVAEHYGDPFGEQRALTETVGFVDRSNRGVLAVGGQDRLSWLHSLTTQHLTESPAWQGTEALILSPHGHLEHHLLVADDGETTWLDVEPGTSGAVLTFLDSMRFLLRVDPRDVSGDWAVLTLVGPSTAAVLDGLEVELGAPMAVAPWKDGGFARRTGEATDLVVPRADLVPTAERLKAVGAVPAGTWAYDALRVSARRPRLGWETDHRTIVQEGDWLERAVHLDKGCYRGQETVARVHNLGRPPRRLVLLHLDGSAETLPAHGDAVTVDGRQVGFVGTAARHYELGPIALALVKRTIADGTPVKIGQLDASIDTG